MEDDNPILTFVWLCIPLSLLSFGGGQTIHAGLQQQAVEVQHWLSAQEFTELFAISKVAPGPGTLITALIGWKIGGIFGAMAGALAIFLPSSLLLYGAGAVWQRNRGAHWVGAIERALMPIAVGLIAAGALAVARIANLGLIDLIAVALALVVLNWTKLGPYHVLGTGGLIYLILSLIGIAT